MLFFKPEDHMIHYGFRKWSTCFYTSLGVAKARTAGKQDGIPKTGRKLESGLVAAEVLAGLRGARGEGAEPAREPLQGSFLSLFLSHLRCIPSLSVHVR